MKITAGLLLSSSAAEAWRLTKKNVSMIPVACYKESDKGADYLGTKDSNSMGAKCLNWTKVPKQKKDTYVAQVMVGDTEYAVMGDHNYCRNVDPAQFTEPVCYTVDQPEGEPSPCGVEMCDPKGPFAKGAEWFKDTADKLKTHMSKEDLNCKCADELYGSTTTTKDTSVAFLQSFLKKCPCARHEVAKHLKPVPLLQHKKGDEQPKEEDGARALKSDDGEGPEKKGDGQHLPLLQHKKGDEQPKEQDGARALKMVRATKGRWLQHLLAKKNPCKCGSGGTESPDCDCEKAVVKGDGGRKEVVSAVATKKGDCDCITGRKAGGDCDCITGRKTKGDCDCITGRKASGDCDCITGKKEVVSAVVVKKAELKGDCDCITGRKESGDCDCITGRKENNVTFLQRQG